MSFRLCKEGFISLLKSVMKEAIKQLRSQFFFLIIWDPSNKSSTQRSILHILLQDKGAFYICLAYLAFMNTNTLVSDAKQ